MQHAAETWEYRWGSGQCARGAHRPTTACGAGRFALAADIRGTAASEFSALLCRAIGFAHRHLDAKHRARVAGLSAHRLEIVARRRRGRWLSADDVVFDLGRLRGRSASEAADRALDTDRDDGFGAPVG